MEQKALLRAIRKAPADLTLRLVYADWLDEHDDPLAAYVRPECDLLAAEPGGPEWRAAIDRLIAVTRKAKTNLGGWEYADDIARLRARSGRRGSSCNLLRAPPDELAVLRFEQRHRITLPGEYRAFLLRLGNGWAEPNRNGICRVDPAGNIPTLTKPFPHSPRRRPGFWQSSRRRSRRTATTRRRVRRTASTRTKGASASPSSGAGTAPCWSSAASCAGRSGRSGTPTSRGPTTRSPGRSGSSSGSRPSTRPRPGNRGRRGNLLGPGRTP